LFYSLKVYDGKGTLEEGETAEARFIKIQAAYELLIDDERRKAYDKEHYVNPMKVCISMVNYFTYFMI
jgi:preprotein translocase subunit Sec63